MIQLLELILCKTSWQRLFVPRTTAPLNAQGAYALTLSKSAIMKWQSVDEEERLEPEFHLRPISHCRTKVCFLLKEFHQLLVQQLGQMFGPGSALGNSLGSEVLSHNAPTTLDFWKKSKGKMTVSNQNPEPGFWFWVISVQFAGGAAMAKGALVTIN